MSPDDAPAESGRTRRVVTLMLVGALAIALTAAVVLWRDRSGLMDRVERAEDARGSAGPAAEAAARDAVTRMTTYDHRTVEEDFGWVEDAGTPEFEETFTGASADAVRLIKGLRSSAVGTVIASAATVEDAGHVRVLLFVDQELRAPGQAEPALEESRVIMQMVRQDGRWLVDDVQLLNLLGQ
jgi:Mce-associated membrane protein